MFPVHSRPQALLRILLLPLLLAACGSDDSPTPDDGLPCADMSASACLSDGRCDPFRGEACDGSDDQVFVACLDDGQICGDTPRSCAPEDDPGACVRVPLTCEPEGWVDGCPPGWTRCIYDTGLACVVGD